MPSQDDDAILSQCYLHHLNFSFELTKVFLCRILFDSESAKRIVKPNTSILVIFMDNFYIEITQNRSLIDCMQQEFNLNHIPTASPTTLGNTLI